MKQIKQVACAMGVIGDPLSDYKLAVDDSGSPLGLFCAGHCDLWSVQRAWERSSKTEVSIWWLRVDDLHRRYTSQADEILLRAQAGVRLLARLRHPSLLRVLRTLDEDKHRKRYFFVTESVSMTLHHAAEAGLLQFSGQDKDRSSQPQLSHDPLAEVFGIADGSNGSHGQIRQVTSQSNSTNVADRSGVAPNGVAMDLLDAEIGLCDIARGLDFMHSVAKCVHLGLSPKTIVLCDSSPLSQQQAPPSSVASPLVAGLTWKLADLSFACSIAELDTIPPPFSNHFAEARSRTPSATVTPIKCPDLNFASPDYVQRSSPGTTSDLWSFGCLVHWVLTSTPRIESRALVDVANDLTAYDRRVAALRRLINPSSSLEAEHPPRGDPMTLRGTAVATTGLDFFSSGASTGTSSPSAITLLNEDVRRLLGAPAAVQGSFTSFADFLLRSTIHAARARTVTLFDNLPTLSPDEKLDAFKSMYRLVGSLKSTTLERRVLGPIQLEMSHPRVYCYAAPLILASLPNLTPAAILATARPLLITLLTAAPRDTNLAIILLEGAEQMQHAANVSNEIARSAAQFVVACMAQWGSLDVLKLAVRRAVWTSCLCPGTMDDTIAQRCVDVIERAVAASAPFDTATPEGVVGIAAEARDVIVALLAKVSNEALSCRIAPALCKALRAGSTGSYQPQHGVCLVVLQALEKISGRLQRPDLAATLAAVGMVMASLSENLQEYRKVAHMLVDRLAE